MKLEMARLSSRALVCLVQGLIEQTTNIELRDETCITGTIYSVDGYLNIEMSNVTYTAPSGLSQQFSRYCCQGKFIRFVHIPDDIDPIKTIKNKLEDLSTRPAYGRGGRGGGRRGGGGGGKVRRGGGDGFGSSGYRSGGKYGGGGSGYRSSSHYGSQY